MLHSETRSGKRLKDRQDEWEMAGEDSSVVAVWGRAPPPATIPARAELAPLEGELYCNHRTEDEDEDEKAHIVEAMASQVPPEQDEELSPSILSPKVDSGQTELPEAEGQAAVGGQPRSVNGLFGHSIPDSLTIADTE